MRLTCHLRLRRASWALVGTCAALVAAGCHRAEPGGEAPEAVKSAEQPVSVVEAGLRPWPRIVRVQGTLSEDESAQLGVKVAGRVKEVLVDIGSKVALGQPIAKLDTEEFDLMVRQAEAQVAQARATLGLKGNTLDDKVDPQKASPVLQELALLEDARLNVNRAHRFTEKSVFTQEEIQARESTLRVAEARHVSALNSVHEQIAVLALRRAELALAIQNRKDAIVKAPFNGIVHERHVAPGSYVSIGQPVATLVRISPLRFRAGVPERSVTGVSVGQPIRLMLEAQPQPLEAKISRISPLLDLSSRALAIEADIDNSSETWRAGLFAEAEILVDPGQRALAVPAHSVVAFGGVEKVWIVKDNHCSPRPVRTGRRSAEYVEIIDGLEAGELVVAEGPLGREGVVRAERQTPAARQDQAAILGQ
ncbi:MAG TPA: efflux RND transporter periplasmic adaptor subunit [Pirellulales bacterium]|jgi:RND family efflux transporter MFP subunit|nr:efflux RND transporter periplasmic adaptor subunit [Pirellulales bacterium]